MIDISSIDKKVYLKKLKRFSSYTEMIENLKYRPSVMCKLQINYTCKQCARLAFAPVHIVKCVIYKPTALITYTCIYICYYIFPWNRNRFFFALPHHALDTFRKKKIRISILILSYCYAFKHWHTPCFSWCG